MCVSEQISYNCWNIYDTYGEICVHCGCCSKDKETRYKSRIQLLKRLIEQEENFNDWEDGFRELQEGIVKYNLKLYKRKLRYYMNKLNDITL